MTAPVVLAVFSPYLNYRGTAYIVGGFAGILCLSLMLVQPLLPAGYLPLPMQISERRVHLWIGRAIVICVALHIGGLFITSPADTLDALLLVAPTPFSVYGIIAMWGIVATVFLVLLRTRFRMRPLHWKRLHNMLALIVVAATVLHAVQIEGTMERVSKWLLCMAVLVATVTAMADLRFIRQRANRYRR
ncbi:ferric reductase-like transmembrane domain-containing protein [Qingshengfaniella alkalisoli]|uniref:Ferric reductase n=1 Tax=Qingshengfaniella alkalisoli TaxID=2599296 RepID=A0A5B8J3K6_9RHOB|nr:ferric reductase-like transmembrane domain-containing protein [Qingshengfaniella alkalisoli]QDY71661.1 ferric reductase [Qingshengfaniella alkalisoli]